MAINIIKPKQDFADLAFDACHEFPITEDGKSRPCLLLMVLTYKGIRRRFALPCRSNINAQMPGKHKGAKKRDFIELKPTDRTGVERIAGIHLEKMFPVTQACYERYFIKEWQRETLIKPIEENYDKIVKKAQKYLGDSMLNHR